MWATLLDEGRYLASERTMYRLLAAQPLGILALGKARFPPPLASRRQPPRARVGIAIIQLERFMTMEVAL
ncbi:MAG: hypothetical protein M3417_14425 [Actinomycetota bacterium]|nr:hypothetical protein [Actinomycetota bacterium]